MPTINGTDGDVTGFLPDENAIRAYRTATFSFLAPAAVYPFSIPAIAGKRFIHNNFTMNLHLVTKVGTVTGAFVVSIAQNGVAVPASSTGSASAASLNTLAAPCRAAVNILTIAELDNSAPLQILVVTPATGATELTGFFEIHGVYK